MWDIKLKLMDIDNDVVVAKSKGMECVLMNGDGRRFDFRWWAHSAIYRSCIIDTYTSNLYDPIAQCHPNQFDFKNINSKFHHCSFESTLSFFNFGHFKDFLFVLASRSLIIKC